MALLRKKKKSDFHPLKGERQAMWWEKGRDHASPGG